MTGDDYATRIGTGVFTFVVEGIGQSAKEIKGTKEDLSESLRSGELFMSLYRRVLNCRQDARKRKIREDDWEQERRERERRFNEQQALHQEVVAENLRRDQLLAGAERWDTHCKVARYVEAVAQAAGASPAGPVLAWLEWAHGVLEDANPVSVLIGTLNSPSADVTSNDED